MSERIVRLGFNQHGVLEWRVEPPVVVAGGPNLNVTHYRVRDDNISSPNNTPTWLGNEDSNPTAARQTGTANSFVVRFQLDESNNKSGSWSLQLNYDYNSGTATGTVGSASSYVRMYGATSRGGISDNAAITTSRLTSATGTFENGICDTATGTESFNNSSNGAWTEYEWIVYIVDADVSNGDTINLYLTGQNGSSVGGPTITVSKATTVQGSATLTGSADVAATGQVQVAGVSTATGAADLTATASVTHYGSATLTGSADVTAAGSFVNTLTRTAAGLVHADDFSTDTANDYTSEPVSGGTSYGHSVTGGRLRLSINESTSDVGLGVTIDAITGGLGPTAIWCTLRFSQISNARFYATLRASDNGTNGTTFNPYDGERLLVGSSSNGSNFRVEHRNVISGVEGTSTTDASTQSMVAATDYDMQGFADDGGQFLWMESDGVYVNTTSTAFDDADDEIIFLGYQSGANNPSYLEIDDLVITHGHKIICTGMETGHKLQVWDGGVKQYEATETSGTATIDVSKQASGSNAAPPVGGYDLVRVVNASNVTVKEYYGAVYPGDTYEASSTVSGSATLTGSADLTATGTTTVKGSATLTGSADLSATASVQHYGVSTATGSADLTATASVVHYNSATLTGSADLTATASVVHYNSATLTGSADLTATGNTNIKGQATLTGSADTSGTASVQHFASLIAAGAAFLIATASVTHNAQATITGSADLSGTGVTNEYGTALLTGTADLFGTATLYLPSASATLTGSADLSATASVQHFASATLTGSADLSGTGSLGGEAFGEATVTGSADLAATASVVHYAVATLTGAADVSGTGSLSGSAAGEATLTGAGYLTALASVQHYASAVLTGSGDLSGTGWVHVWGDATLTGSADLSGTGVVNEYGTCLLTGTADLFGTATLTLPSGSATATGSADVSASASVQHYGAASLTGQASVSGSGTVAQGTVYGSATLTGSAEVVATAYFTSVSSNATMTGSAEVVATGWLSKVGGVATLTGKAYAWAGDYPGQGYFAYLYNGEYFRLAKWSPLTGLVILDEVAFVHTPSTYYNIVLEADGNTLNAKVWEGNPNIPPGVADDENEPVGWMISVTDPDYAGGTPGLVALGTADVKFDVFSTGLGGSTYPLGRLPGAPTWVTPTVPFSVPENDPIVPLSWLRPYMTGDVLGGVVNYELEYKREADTEWTFLTSTNETSYDWDLSRYPNSESYCVRVRAYVGCEYGPWAEICGIGWGGQAPTFETPDGYYFGDDNVGEPDHGMWIRLFQASHRDDEYQVNACLVTREIMPGGVNGECLFQKLYVNLTYSTAGQCVVTPILDGERITEETRYIDLDPGEGIVTRRFELDLARGFTTSSERFRYGMRGTYFQVEICVTDVSGTGRIEIDGISLAYTKARETHPWARPFYGELETDVQPDIGPGYFFGTGTDDVPAALYELATNDRDFGRELRVRIQPRAMAPFGTAAESWFRMLYICFTRSNTLDRQIKVTPIIDGQELDAVYLTLEGTTQPKTEIHEVPLKMSYPSATLERSTYGIRGLWFTYRLETVTQRPDGELSIDGTAVEVLYDRESEPNTP